MAEVHLPRSLVALFPGTPRRLTAHGETVADVIASLDAQVPGIRNRLLDAGPSIRTHINVFVAGQRAALGTPVPADAVVHVIPAVSGGASMSEGFVPATPAESRPIDAPGAGARGAGGGTLDDPRALTILTTEHWGLLSARSLVYNEAFARAGMFLALLSATLVGLGLISTATGFSDAFLAVVAVVLALDLFVGLASLGRVAAANAEDITYLQGMNRIRNAYDQIVPGLGPYLIASKYDDFRSVVSSYGPPSTGGPNIWHGFTTTAGMLSVICCAVSAGLTAVLLLLVTHDPTLAGVGALLAFAILFPVSVILSLRRILGFSRSLQVLFPRPVPPDES